MKNLLLKYEQISKQITNKSRVLPLNIYFIIFLFWWGNFIPNFTGLRLDPPYWYFIRYFCISISILFLSDAFKNYFKCIKRKKPLGCLSAIFLIINFFCFLFVLFFEYIFFPQYLFICIKLIKYLSYVSKLLSLQVLLKY